MRASLIDHYRDFFKIVTENSSIGSYYRQALTLEASDADLVNKLTTPITTPEGEQIYCTHLLTHPSLSELREGQIASFVFMISGLLQSDEIALEDKLALLSCSARDLESEDPTKKNIFQLSAYQSRLIFLIKMIVEMPRNKEIDLLLLRSLLVSNEINMGEVLGALLTITKHYEEDEEVLDVLNDFLSVCSEEIQENWVIDYIQFLLDISVMPLDGLTFILNEITLKNEKTLLNFLFENTARCSDILYRLLEMGFPFEEKNNDVLRSTIFNYVKGLLDTDEKQACLEALKIPIGAIEVTPLQKLFARKNGIYTIRPDYEQLIQNELNALKGEIEKFTPEEGVFTMDL